MSPLVARTSLSNELLKFGVDVIALCVRKNWPGASAKLQFAMRLDIAGIVGREEWTVSGWPALPTCRLATGMHGFYTSSDAKPHYLVDFTPCYLLPLAMHQPRNWPP
jgi:hypothetical protein